MKSPTRESLQKLFSLIMKTNNPRLSRWFLLCPSKAIDFSMSLPLDRSRRFARDVVDDAVDVCYFVHDASADRL